MKTIKLYGYLTVLSFLTILVSSIGVFWIYDDAPQLSPAQTTQTPAIILILTVILVIAVILLIGSLFKMSEKRNEN